MNEANQVLWVSNDNSKARGWGLKMKSLNPRLVEEKDWESKIICCSNDKI